MRYKSLNFNFVAVVHSFQTEKKKRCLLLFRPYLFGSVLAVFDVPSSLRYFFSFLFIITPFAQHLLRCCLFSAVFIAFLACRSCNNCSFIKIMLRPCTYTVCVCVCPSKTWNIKRCRHILFIIYLLWHKCVGYIGKRFIVANVQILFA